MQADSVLSEPPGNPMYVCMSIYKYISTYLGIFVILFQNGTYKLINHLFFLTSISFKPLQEIHIDLMLFLYIISIVWINHILFIYSPIINAQVVSSVFVLCHFK